MTLGERIQTLRRQAHISQVDFAEKIGVSKQTLYKYENGLITNIPFDKVEVIADLFQVSPAYLLGWESSQSGSSAFSASMAEYHFDFLIRDDHMEPRICEGDTVIAHQQDHAETGDIVIIQVDGDQKLCRRLLNYAGGIGLLSLNSKYDPVMFSRQEIQEKSVRILGKVVELRGKV